MTELKRINLAIITPLKEALSLVLWFKNDLRAFMSIALPDVGLVALLDWTEFKRNLASQIVDIMAQNQARYFDQLLDLILATAEITDPHHLKRIDDGQQKY